MSKDERKSRRELLRTAGVVAGAAVVGQLAGAESAAAGDGSNLLLGVSVNSAVSKTVLTTSGTIPSDAALSSALTVIAPQADYGIAGDAASYGVVGKGAGGVLGLGTVGGVFSGSTVAINLDPQEDPGAPIGQAFKGDLAVDSTGVLWLCVADGTPGTWIQVSHGGVRLLPTPQRAYSSTEVSGGARMNQGETRTIPIGGVVAGVPTIARGVVINLTVHLNINGGFVTAFPAGSSLPSTSTVNWNTSNQAVANGATIGLGTGGAVSLFVDAAVAPGSPATHVIVDVTGYVL
jgi:hypothetical protein